VSWKGKWIFIRNDLNCTKCKLYS